MALSATCSWSLVQEESVRFPRMSERALSGEQVELPGALMGQTTLVLVALRELGMVSRVCEGGLVH